MDLAPLHLLRFPFLLKKQACGPEARSLRGKSIGGKSKRLKDPPVIPQDEAGPSSAQPGAPTSDQSSSWGKNGLPARSKK